MRLQLISAFLLVANCTATFPELEPQQLSASFSTTSVQNLCTMYSASATPPLNRLMIEAELASRSIRQCSGTNYGGVSVAAFGSNLYSRTTPSSSPTSANLRNCSDFATGAAAQRYFLASGGPVADPNDLDRDGDGLACEWGTQIRQIASYRAPVATAPRSSPTRVRTSSPSRSRCYRGPRGGTYTITRSGRKNYGGC